MISLIRANCGYLQQATELLERHSADSFSHADPSTFGSSVGSHLRHVLEHYLSFLAGCEGGTIDYDSRPRNKGLETDRAIAIGTTRRTIERIAGLEDEADRDLQVCVSVSIDRAREFSRSSLKRELQFLVSHTVHHYALIAVASRMQGILPAEDFGVAPSTLKYRQTVGS